MTAEVIPWPYHRFRPAFPSSYPWQGAAWDFCALVERGKELVLEKNDAARVMVDAWRGGDWDVGDDAYREYALVDRELHRLINYIQNPREA